MPKGVFSPFLSFSFLFFSTLLIGGVCCRCGQEPAHLCQHGHQNTAAVSDAAGARSRFPRAVGTHSASASGTLLSTLLCQQQLASCAAVMVLHHVYYRTHLGVHSANPASSLPFTLLCQQQLAACAAIMIMHHVVTEHIWAPILQVLQVVYIPLCFVTSSLQNVLLLRCIMVLQKPSDRILCPCCLFASPNSCCWKKAVLETSLDSIS